MDTKHIAKHRLEGYPLLAKPRGGPGAVVTSAALTKDHL